MLSNNPFPHWATLGNYSQTLKNWLSVAAYLTKNVLYAWKSTVARAKLLKVANNFIKVTFFPYFQQDGWGMTLLGALLRSFVAKCNTFHIEKSMDFGKNRDIFVNWDNSPILMNDDWISPSGLIEFTYHWILCIQTSGAHLREHKGSIFKMAFAPHLMF